VAKEVIARVHNLDPPGRFLTLRDDGMTYEEVEDIRAFDKTCQALREKKWVKSSEDIADDIRAQVQWDEKRKKKQQQMTSTNEGGHANAGGESADESESSDGGGEGSSDDGSSADGEERGAEEKMKKSGSEDIQPGAKVSVYWPLDGAYYKAVVHERDGGRVRVEYTSDGLMEWLELSDNDVKLDVPHA